MIGILERGARKKPGLPVLSDPNAWESLRRVPKRGFHSAARNVVEKDQFPQARGAGEKLLKLIEVHALPRLLQRLAARDGCPDLFADSCKQLPEILYIDVVVQDWAMTGNYDRRV